MLACTSPMPYREKALQQAIEQLRPKLKALLKKSNPNSFDC